MKIMIISDMIVLRSLRIFYIAAAAKLQNEIAAIITASASTQQPSGAWSPTRAGSALGVQPVNHAHLMGHSTPKIPIPTFNGSQKEWDSFKEFFTASIINDGRLSEIVKLQNLLLHFSGPAK